MKPSWATSKSAALSISRSTKLLSRDSRWLRVTSISSSLRSTAYRTVCFLEPLVRPRSSLALQRNNSSSNICELWPPCSSHKTQHKPVSLSRTSRLGSHLMAAHYSILLGSGITPTSFSTSASRLSSAK